MPTIWITGASSGIGAALAAHYARAGWQVAVTARRVEPLESVAAAYPQNIHPYPADVVDAAQMAQVARRIYADLGRLDVVILNAGTHLPVDGKALTPEPFSKLLNINVMGVVNGLVAVQPLLQTQAAGAQVAIVSSVAGWRGLPSAAAYSASKAALIAMAESLKFDFDSQNIRLSLVLPGFVRTPLTDKNPFPMPFLLEPAEAARRIAGGLERGKFLITFPRRFTWWLQVLRILPYAWYFWLVRRFTKC